MLDDEAYCCVSCRWLLKATLTARQRGGGDSGCGGGGRSAAATTAATVMARTAATAKRGRMGLGLDEEGGDF